MNEPANPTVSYERTDVDTRAVVWFVTGLVASIALVMVMLVGLYASLETRVLDKRQNADALAESTRLKLQRESPNQLLPPEPRLDGLGPLPKGTQIGRIQPEPAAFPPSPAKDNPNAWRWMNEDHSIASIPVDEAINRMLKNPEQFFKASKEPKPEQPGGSR